MEKVLTITLNPAIDVSTTIPALLPEKKLRCSAPSFEPGGGGVNVSRVLHKIGYPSTAMFMAGGHTGQFFTELVEKEDIETLVVPIEGSTRQNLIVHDGSNYLQYRFGMPGPDIAEREWRNCLLMLKNAKDFSYTVISGSNPAGVPPDFYAEAADIVKAKGSKLILDTSGDALKFALEEGVFLAKPNLGELSHLAGGAELDANSVVEAARVVINKSNCEVLVVSMGAAGAMLITANEYYHQPAPTIKIKSTVGAGDSMVAGIIIGMQKQLPWKDVLKYGVAAGTAATINAGSGLCTRENLDKVRSFFIVNTEETI
ncbi:MULTISPECIES: 1-phosphofructokinase family hexose kinase [Niastella]|uniref:1-phosphofructokinase family hexose kinase n=1 Tax=Niastella soli TaxID=2821487 RepID=A0ABS3Z2A5_9BACT|nr:1-phosphofructokinase family hexose kinase [Niastella soli]MBO9204285.1 1-phosphofructokinase family hexose kinase [Niastella soli]